MELGCGKINELFVPVEEQINKYYSDEYDVYETRSLNNIYTFSLRVAEGATVLDVGCAQGKTGVMLQKQKCVVYGLEYDSVSAKIAMKTGAYKDIAVCDVTVEEDSNFKRILEAAQAFDVIIFSDILEHLVNPTDVLTRFASYLNPQGKILVSVPNIGHADIVLNLLNGRFNYSRMGIMDNTHLKFFTKRSFAEWIKQINLFEPSLQLECEFLGTVYYCNEYLEMIKTQYPKLYKILQCNENYLGLTVMFELTRKERKENTPLLDELLQEKQRDVVGFIGECIEKGELYLDNRTIERGERLWYETQFEQMENIKASNEELLLLREGYLKYIDELESKIHDMERELQKEKEYVVELEEKSREAHDVIGKKNVYITELEEKVQQTAQDLEIEKRLETLEKLLEARDSYILKLEKEK